MNVEAQVTVHGSRAAVWAAITDIANAAAIINGIEKIEIVERPANGLVGLRWRETRILFGKPATAEKWITEAKENEFYSTRAEDGDFVFLTTMRISESGGSVTLASAHETRPQGFVAQLKSLPMVFFKGMIKKAILQDLNDIKAAVKRVGRSMHIELALFDGDALIDRVAIRVGPSESADTFSQFRVTHRLGTDAADVVLSDFASHIRLVKVTLDMPFHESSDWESIKLNVESYTVAFWCRLDA